ncbi:energy transducer TonB [Odoribacter sp. OttesenSCG-928-J03]|nr:energy transducer TonB [Odoribacter sp. OttesenSCG-928-J03]MDL2282988.1 energy transducer TonB [Odoribacter sp. OttesenSCG-928-G04]
MKKAVLKWCVVASVSLLLQFVSPEVKGQDTTVYTVADVMPSFPGNMMAWIRENIQYPREVYKDKMKGRVVLSVLVEKDGTLSDIRILRPVHENLDKEALRLVGSMPQWSPGLIQDIPVRVKHTVMVTYDPDNILYPSSYLEYIQALEMQKTALEASDAGAQYLADCPGVVEKLKATYTTDKVAYTQIRGQHLLLLDEVGDRVRHIGKRLSLPVEEEVKLYNICEKAARRKVDMLETIGTKNFIMKYCMLRWELDKLSLQEELNIRELLGDYDYMRYYEIFLLSENISVSDSIEYDETSHVKCDTSCVGVNPRFNGNLSMWMSENLRYPPSAVIRDGSGRVIVFFVVEEDGSISEVKVLKGAGDTALDAEAVRVAQAMPKWIPGRCLEHNRPVRVSFMLPIVFKLERESTFEEHMNMLIKQQEQRR